MTEVGGFKSPWSTVGEVMTGFCFNLVWLWLGWVYSFGVSIYLCFVLSFWLNKG